ncbi:hypothetical protein [Stenotrophomonas sp. PS02298]|nr:hypothetical protein [Stenotrophomonas sp. PS02298]
MSRAPEEEMPPWQGHRITDALHRQFDQVFGPGYARQPEPQQQKETPNEE